MFQRDDLAPRAAGDAHDARRGGLPVQETLGTAVAILRARDLAVRVVVVTLFTPAGVGDDV